VRRAARIDGNQKRMDELARACGAHIVFASAAPSLGFDRIYVLRQPFICEIKDPAQPPSRRRLTDNEQKAKADIEAAGGQYHILETDDDMLRLFGMKS